MTRSGFCLLLTIVWLAAACGGGEKRGAAEDEARVSLPPDQADAETLGREVLELVDRAVDYRGSHRGRPATSLRQLGIDSLTPTTARHLISVNREPVVTVSFRKTDDRQITSCRGDGNILEESSINAGRFTLMCTSRSGAQRPIQVGGIGP
ncbi:MAG TPA: hypothetical protein VJ794_00690 [Gemmatimonadales bacterium]|nr:hypothetical protein [Gemmatimonadales bacterium]